MPYMQAGSLVLHTFMDLIRKYGERKKAHWLNLVRAVMVVDGVPIKENQNTVLQVRHLFSIRSAICVIQDGVLFAYRIHL